MPMREDCKQFESRSYPNGETVRKCNLDKAPEAPWRCPENCVAFEKRRVDVNWSYGSLITPETPEEPSSLGEDQSISALLNAAEDVINEAGPRVLAEFEKQQSKKGRSRLKKIARKSKKKKRKK
ncbi:MAG: hypothetical protein QGF06_02815 [Acidimicrobiales bacterium]|jgi:hypothetical protein|nr:hypothetical protein [Acidimicrobiales bacterium]HJM37539.1 hypothetical protein [Acidimicrobiales bacterium]|tara:strand:- start:1254 stop:1625 length:372 start_codon:yes stop_codon:yes gene_type:complete